MAILALFNNMLWSGNTYGCWCVPFLGSVQNLSYHPATVTICPTLTQGHCQPEGSHFTPSSCSASLQASWRVPLLLQLPTSSQAWRSSMLPLLAPHWTSWGSPSPLEAGKGHQPLDGLCLLCLASWPGLKCYLFLLGLSCSLLLFDIPFGSQFVKWLLWSPLFLVFSALVTCFS